MKLAIVVLNWNGADMLRTYLPSVVRCSQTEGVEVFVADNASTDDSLKVLKNEFPAIHTVVLEENHGYAGGYNRALRQIEAEYYLLLNSDVEIRQEGWVEPLLAYMEAHPDTAACQPKIRHLRQPEKFEYAGAAGGFIDRYGYPYCRGRILNVTEDDHGQYDEPCEVHWCAGCSLMVRAKDFWAVGGFDERFFAHMEEIDLCWRLRLRGKRLVCLTDSMVFHLGAATLKQGSPRKTFLNFRNNMLMLYKNLPDNELDRVLRWRTWLDRLAALHFLVAFDWKNCKAVFKAQREFERIFSDFALDRQQIQSLRSVPKDRTDVSILWQYYFRRRKRFSQL